MADLESHSKTDVSFSQIACFSCLETTFNGRRLVRLNSKRSIDEKLQEKLERLFYLYDKEYDIKYDKLLEASAGMCQVCLKKLETTLDFLDMMVPTTDSFLNQSISLKKPITKAAIEESKSKVVALMKKIPKDDKRLSCLLLEKSTELYNNQLYSDITIKLKDDSIFYGHKVILATRSEYWKVEDSIQELDLKEKDADIIKVLLTWVYKDELSTNHTEEFMKSLYQTATELNLIPLSNKCERIMISNVDITNCLKYYKLSEEISAELLKQHCKDLMSHCQIKVSLVDKRSLEKKSELLLDPTTEMDDAPNQSAMQLNYDVDADNKVNVQLVSTEDENTTSDLIDCQVCNKIFLLSDDLAEHMKIHAEEETEICKQEPDVSEVSDEASHESSKKCENVELTAIKANKKSPPKQTFSKRGRRLKTKVKDEIVDEVLSDDPVEEFDEEDDDEDYESEEEVKPKRRMSLRTSPRTFHSPRSRNTKISPKTPTKSPATRNSGRDHVSPKKKKQSSKDQDEEKDDYEAARKDLEEFKEALDVLKDQVSLIIPDLPDLSPYKCLKCEEGFLNKVEMQKHMKVHNGEKPFQCNVCEESCSTLFQLDVHIRSHVSERPYKCDLCEKTFKNIFNLKKHLPLHNSRTQIQCEVCGKNYTSLKSLERHQIHHLDDKDKPHQCEICGKGFADPYYFKIHSRIHVGEKPYQCETCGKAFGHSSTYHKHIKIHEAKKNFYCADCDEHFPSKVKLHVHLAEHTEESLLTCSLCGHHCLNKSALSSHLQRKHASEEDEARILKDVEEHVEKFEGESKAFKCKVCQKYFNAAYDIKVHMAVHSGLKPFKCDICGYGFERRSHLGIHRKKHRDEKPHQCDVCGEGFRTPYLLKIHGNKHLGIESRRKTSYKCKVCKATVITYRRLQIHIRAHADNQDYLKEEYLALNAGNPKITKEYLKQYIESRIQKYTNVCEICGRSFGGNFYLKIHMRTHTKEKPYKCDVCGKSFTSPASRRNHKLSHGGVKNFKCEICEAAFYTNAILRKHLKTHSGERPFQCDTCGKAFKTKGTLRDHIKFHVGDKPFKCELCDKAFVLKTALTCHKRTHTGEKPFECRLCFKRFSDNRSKKKHESTHSNETYQLPQIHVVPSVVPTVIPTPMTNRCHPLQHQVLPQQLQHIDHCQQTIEIRPPPLPTSMQQMTHRTLQPIHHRVPVHVPNTQSTTFSVDGVEINQSVSFIQLGTYHQL